jgi:tRNA (guanine37-N1)-methyltransferase
VRFTVLTLFPEAFPGTLGVSIPAKNLGTKWHLDVINIRDYGLGKYKQVDDEVYGGGSGMLLRADVIGNILDDLLPKLKNPKIIMTAARGELYNQKIAHNLMEYDDVVIICGRFEGIDQRVVEYYNMMEISIGKFVLFGGELPAMCIMESIVRLQDGVCGNSQSLEVESYAIGTAFENKVEYPQYTRPAVWKGIGVPEVLLSGHHGEIEKWRNK